MSMLGVIFYLVFAALASGAIFYKVPSLVRAFFLSFLANTVVFWVIMWILP